MWEVHIFLIGFSNTKSWQVHISTRRQLTSKGKRFSLPAPKVLDVHHVCCFDFSNSDCRKSSQLLSYTEHRRNFAIFYIEREGSTQWTRAWLNTENYFHNLSIHHEAWFEWNFLREVSTQWTHAWLRTSARLSRGWVRRLCLLQTQHRWTWMKRKQEENILFGYFRMSLSRATLRSTSRMSPASQQCWGCKARSESYCIFLNNLFGRE